MFACWANALSQVVLGKPAHTGWGVLLLGVRMAGGNAAGQETPVGRHMAAVVRVGRHQIVRGHVRADRRRDDGGKDGRRNVHRGRRLRLADADPVAIRGIGGGNNVLLLLLLLLLLHARVGAAIDIHLALDVFQLHAVLLHGADAAPSGVALELDDILKLHLARLAAVEDTGGGGKR